jgi:hypothetical protein
MFLDIINRPVLCKTPSCVCLKHNVLETGLCLCLQVKPSQLGPIDRASPYVWTPAPTQDRLYNQAQHKPSARVKTLKNSTCMRPSTRVLSE